MGYMAGLINKNWIFFYKKYKLWDVINEYVKVGWLIFVGMLYFYCMVGYEC